MKALTSLLGSLKAFQARNDQDFNCVRKADEDEEDGVTDDQKMYYEKPGQPLPTEPCLR